MPLSASIPDVYKRQESVKSFLYSLPLTVILSLVLAVILNQKFRGRLLARAVFFLPVIIATGVVLEIFNTDVMAEQVREGSNSYITGGIDFALILTRMDLPPNLVEPMVTFIEEIFDLVWGLSLIHISRGEGQAAAYFRCILLRPASQADQHSFDAGVLLYAASG